MRVPVFLFPFLLALLTGCGGENRQPVHPAKGQILFDGKATPHALVVFHPVNPADKDAPRPTGTVDKDGRFVLTTYDQGDGAPAGEYGVTVEWWLTSTKARTQEGDSPPPTNRLPARYARVETSKLRARIEAASNEIPVIKLTR